MRFLKLFSWDLNEATKGSVLGTKVLQNIYVIVAFNRGLWQYRLWSFQGRDKKLEIFLAENQL